MQIIAAIAFGTILTIAFTVVVCFVINRGNFVDLDGRQ